MAKGAATSSCAATSAVRGFRRAWGVAPGSVMPSRQLTDLVCYLRPQRLGYVVSDAGPHDHPGPCDAGGGGSPSRRPQYGVCVPMQDKGWLGKLHHSRAVPLGTDLSALRITVTRTAVYLTRHRRTARERTPDGTNDALRLEEPRPIVAMAAP